MYQGLYPDSDIAIVPTGWKSKKDPFTSKQVTDGWRSSGGEGLDSYLP